MSNRLNDLTGSQWIGRSRSVIRFRHRPPRWMSKSWGSAAATYRPPRLCRDIVETLTTLRSTVFDPFAGLGGIVLGAQMAGRRVVGCEVDPLKVDGYRAACDNEGGLFSEYDREAVVVGDCFSLYAGEMAPFADLVFTDPPWYIDDRRAGSGWWQNASGQVTAHFTSVAQWENDIIQGLGDLCRKVLRPGGYVVYFMEDAYVDGEYLFLAERSASAMRREGFVPQGEWVWYNEAKRGRLFGFPARMVTTRTHSSILFFTQER